MRLFAVAAVLAVCGIYFDERWMTGSAIVVLLAAMLLRFVGRGPGRAEGDDAQDGPDEG